MMSYDFTIELLIADSNINGIKLANIKLKIKSGKLQLSPSLI